MTTSAYLALTTVLEESDLIELGFREIVAFGRRFVPYKQALSFEHPVATMAEKLPVPEHSQSPSEPQPLPALRPIDALKLFMEKLKVTNSPWARFAADWLARSKLDPNAIVNGQKIFDQVAIAMPWFIKRLDRAIVAAVKPNAGPASLKLAHSNDNDGISSQPSIASRPYLENRFYMENQPMPEKRVSTNFKMAA